MVRGNQPIDIEWIGGVRTWENAAASGIEALVAVPAALQVASV
jgi:hypothetical protein